MPGVEKRSVSLSSELAAAVDDAVASGEYGNASEVVREALRQWKERRDSFGYTLEELRALVQEGIDSGPPIDAETLFEDLRRRIDRKRAQRPT